MAKHLSENSILIPKPGVDFRLVKLTAQEGFLLSRIQGRTPVRELYQLSTFDRTVTATLIKNLADKRVIEIIEESIPEETENSRLSKLLPKRDYGNFIFSLIDMSEEVELPVELRKEILFLYDRLDDLTYYELFGLPDNAPPEEIRQTFLRLSKIFHPDNYFRKELGSFREKLNAIFALMMRANQVFQNPADVIEYRRVMIEQGRIVKREEDVLETPGEREERLQVEEKRRRSENNPLRDRVNKGREFYEAGLKDEQAEQWISAANNYRLALTYDPQNELYQAKAATSKDAANRVAAQKLYQRALGLESYGQDGYIEAFEKAAALWPQNAEYQSKMAQHYCDIGEWNKAQPYAQRSVKAAPKSKEYLLLLGKILLKLRDKKEALRYLEAALAVDPNSTQAKALLKEARKWF